VLVDLLARESVEVEAIEGGEAHVLKESATVMGGREGGEGKAVVAGVEKVGVAARSLERERCINARDHGVRPTKI
jgi:hypothetical protein